MAVFFLMLSPLPVLAESFSITEIPYKEVEEFTTDVIDFEGAPMTGSVLKLGNGVAFGQHFEGQSISRRQDELLDWRYILETAEPDTPLSASSSMGTPSLTTEWDGHWGSTALHGIGPSIGTRSGRVLGRGTIAIRFDPPVCFVAFRTAIDGMSRYKNVADSVLRGKSEGSLNIRFYTDDARQIASFMRNRNPEGPIEIGYMQAGQAEAQIAGILLQGYDLHGFAIDDIRFDPVCPLKLF
ncbi:hypothetical protein [Paragemmobacter ruber]|uniref:Phosphodiester glycosidase domain-containing protein n=1 Tax=Paragemmobacter ruber TaxID=1985673 RepID=A0ABW9Y6A0_9RHOB|nr:hypothetical protein [Rhodobacter ruber]NBE07917.1 hypothetical protein [Rhodobacter ruber]